MNLNQITIPSADLSKAIPFYETLGLRLIVSTSDRYARFECPNGEVTFSIHLTDQLSKGPRTIVYFETENLDREVERLLALGIHFDQLPVDQPWLWREAHLKDPDGNPVILYHAGKNRLSPPWKLKNRNDAFFKD